MIGYEHMRHSIDCNRAYYLQNFVAIIRMSDYNYTDMICRKDLGVMEYMSCPEAAKKWGISERRVQILCSENRIPGVSKLGYMWLIPKNAEKPFDMRKKQHKMQIQ